jgi:hypothetical protein
VGAVLRGGPAARSCAEPAAAAVALHMTGVQGGSRARSGGDVRRPCLCTRMTAQRQRSVMYHQCLQAQD